MTDKELDSLFRKHIPNDVYTMIRREFRAAVREVIATEAALHRWQHGEQVEGDYACKPALEAQAEIDALKAKLAAAEAERDRLKAELAAWSNAWSRMRDDILNGRGALADNESSYSPNDVLAVIDDAFPVTDAANG